MANGICAGLLGSAAEAANKPDSGIPRQSAEALTTFANFYGGDTAEANPAE